ncbi:HAMP domain-containing histidine kinase [Pelagibius litoralis]|uniref:histidine kinase n=1 Tax=Pelagibius litoralis TaxID=374515 RepID=A0A967F1C4_9PROT|nr:HAMP domain-containing sensor histidine kinase [Pelagibius litoralis]NIA71224.1 HAMP domain-containing histidine kinase [Pelagibius litoralis]
MSGWSLCIATRCRYTVGGILFGVTFPIGTWIFQSILNQQMLSFDSILAMHRSNPVNFVVDLAPFVLGAMGYFIGFKQAALEHLTHSLQDEITQQTQELRLANDAKSQFLANMSHELRSPLNAILGFSEIIKDHTFGKDAPDRYKEYANDIHQSGSHLLALINDILDLAKIEAGKIELEPELLEVESLLEICKRMFGTRATKLDLALDLQVCTQTPLLYADNRAVRQIIFNLLSNALKFTPEGGKISIRARRVPDGGVEIVIQDTGIGIPADQLHKVLEPFEQIDNRYGSLADGTGLGMALVWELVKAHGGTAAIESEEAVGTTVTIVFPPMPDSSVSQQAGNRAVSTALSDKPELAC